MSHVARVFNWPISSIRVNLFFLSAFSPVDQPYALSLGRTGQANDNEQTLLQQQPTVEDVAYGPFKEQL